MSGTWRGCAFLEQESNNMAIAYKINDKKTVCISTDFKRFSENNFVVFIKIKNSMHRIDVIGHFGDNIIIDNEMHQFDEIINILIKENIKDIFIDIVILDRIKNSRIHIENLFFHQNIFIETMGILA